MKQNILLYILGLCLIGTLSQSCTSSISLGASWVNPDEPSVATHKVMTMSMGQDLRNRRIVEDAFALSFEHEGISSVAASDIMPPNFEDLDTNQLQKAVINSGASALVTVRAIDVNTEQHWVPGTTYYPSYYGSYYGYGGFYGYGGYGGYSSPGYMSETTKALIETNLYDVTTGRLVWVGQSEFVVAGKIETLAAKYAAVVVKGMMADGAIKQ